MTCAMVAMTKDRVIGQPGALPWHISEDLKRFKRITMGRTVLMGKNTFDSIGRALPGRNNVVLSHRAAVTEGVDVCTSLDEALEKAKSYGTDVFIIGGASVYEQTLPFVEVLHVSHVKGDYAGTVYFPKYDIGDWKEVEREDFDEFTAVTYKRVRHAQPA